MMLRVNTESDSASSREVGKALALSLFHNSKHYEN